MCPGPEVLIELFLEFILDKYAIVDIGFGTITIVLINKGVDIWSQSGECSGSCVLKQAAFWLCVLLILVSLFSLYITWQHYTSHAEWQSILTKRNRAYERTKRTDKIETARWQLHIQIPELPSLPEEKRKPGTYSVASSRVEGGDPTTYSKLKSMREDLNSKYRDYEWKLKSCQKKRNELVHEQIDLKKKMDNSFLEYSDANHRIPILEEQIERYPITVRDLVVELMVDIVSVTLDFTILALTAQDAGGWTMLGVVCTLLSFVYFAMGFSRVRAAHSENKEKAETQRSLRRDAENATTEISRQLDRMNEQCKELRDQILDVQRAWEATHEQGREIERTHNDQVEYKTAEVNREIADKRVQNTSWLGVTGAVLGGVAAATAGVAVAPATLMGGAAFAALRWNYNDQYEVDYKNVN